MEILLEPEKWVLDKYLYDNDISEYRLSDYIIQVKYNNEILLLHTITWAIYILTEHEFKDILNNSILKQNKVVISNNIDELKVAHDVYLSRITKPLPSYEKIYGFVILTTTACNARCAYCYENDIKEKEVMTLETAEKLVQFLNKKRSNNNPVHIQWFGGEPLLNKGVIDYIIDRLTELNISYVCGITTNGFLLNEDVVNSFKRWNLTTMQITLDGLNDEYNSIKNYIYSDIDAFMIVVNNIHNVLEKTETIVTLRFNVSNDNIFSMYDTIEYLKEEFKEYYNKKIFFYVSPLFEYLKPNINIIDGFWEEFNRISTIVKTSKLNKCETLLETGIFSRGKINKNCFAYDGVGIAIMPNGKFTPCEHIRDEDVFGDVVNGVTNFEVIKRWQTFDGPEIQFCKDSKCPYHPMCPKFFRCDTTVVCTTNKEKERKLDKAKEKLIRTRIVYNNYINNK